MSLNIDYNSITTGILSYLRTQSSTLDTGMYSSITTITEARPSEYIVWATQYPAITVDLVSKTEEVQEFGATLAGARSNVICTFEIGCHIRNLKSCTAVYQAMRTLVKNVEDAIRDDSTFSSTVADSSIKSVEFGSIYKQNDIWQKNGTIILETLNWVTN